jgi:NAD(P) transhydrogenase subunit beta
MIYNIFYLIAAIFFILSLRNLSSPVSAIRGNNFAILGMIIACVSSVMVSGISEYYLVIGVVFLAAVIGYLVAVKISMKDLPQIVAVFHSLVGLAATCVAVSTFYNPQAFGIGNFLQIHMGSLIEMSVGAVIGAVTFSGSLIAFLKLSGYMGGNPLKFKGQNIFNLIFALVMVLVIVLNVVSSSEAMFWLMIFMGFVLGFLLIIPIGGADMPVIVSILNSYSGFATSGIGFTLKNPALVIVGALVGASGAILSYIMCKGMNRSIFNVLLGGMFDSANNEGVVKEKNTKNYKVGNGEDAGFILKNANKVIIVPGYGMAVSQAQHVIKEMADKLKDKGIEVLYAIHPVAGRMPGHMNVLLAEANVPYEDVFELEQINNEFTTADVSIVIGANDVTNPAAKYDKDSPIYGMPILEVSKSKIVFFVKRSMNSGYAGVDNELFYNDNTIMLLGDAKAVIEDVVAKVD